jgi:hypothetical protein
MYSVWLEMKACGERKAAGAILGLRQPTVSWLSVEE